ncbi:MAG TPA: two-component regulator propeller domain-containing protein [Thermoanaerobaculia bacterium]|nr:two-component regulator propeller domain-containing protein [Thermoanaerobaculia bacterium]
MSRPAIALSILLGLFLATGAFALDPHRALTQARLTVWTSDAGLPQNSIETIVQTRDGYLWMGTEEGLARFDGVRFVVSDRETSPALRSPFVSSLFESSDGTLWIGTYGGGLARLRHGRIDAFRPDLLGAERIRGMYEAPSGSIYIATAGGGMLRVDGERVTRYTTRDGLPVDRIWTVISDGAGGLWVATHGGGVVRWRDGKVTQRITSQEGLPNDFARAILRDADGTLWIGTDGAGLAEWRNGAIVRVVTTRDGLPSNLIRAIVRDRNGSLLIGTNGGLVRWRDGHQETLGSADGLPSSIVPAVTEDREGSLWVGTSGGLVRLNDTKLLPFTRKEGLAADAARAILEDREGRMWVGTEGGGLCRMLPAPAHCFTKADGLPQETVYALAESRDGSLWAGTDGGGVVRMRDGRFTDRIAGLPNDHVRALAEMPDGTLWVSTTGGLARVRAGKTASIAAFAGRQLRPLQALNDGTLLVGTDGAGLWRVASDATSASQIATADQGRGLGSDRVFSLAPDSAGAAVWIGTSGGGLSHLDLKTGAMHTLARRDGLHDDVVFQVLDDGKDLWMTSNRGLYRVSRDRVLAAMRGEKSDLSGTVYGTSDGMPSAECTGASPAAIRARDGRIWVATARGVAVVDFNATARNPVPPVVHIDGVLVDGNAVPDGRLHVRAGAQRLEVRYTAVSLRAPERVTFRYRLDGFDHDWIDAGTNRVAHYTRLPAGDYTFRVTASNEDGVPAVAEERLAFTVEPEWFETWWARLLALAVVAAAIWGAIRIRVAAARAHMLRALSYLDGLTGVANRRRFDEALEEACGNARRTGTPLSLALVDLDHFKELNDTSGHLNGDDALRTVAGLLAKRAASAGGLVARFGGEEFAWLLPGIPPEVAKQEAERFRLSVLDAGIRHAGVASGVLSASVGVAGSSGAALQPSTLIAAADAALYRAKSAGRDRVEAEAS